MFRLSRALILGLSSCLATISYSPGAFSSPNRPQIEIAFVLDTTGSMADLIDGAKRKIWSIANTIIDVNLDADIRMALIAYRDQGDAYVLKTFDMSSDVQGLYGNLIKLTADGGGDTPESVNEALDTSVRKIKWSKDDNTKKIVFLVGDAPPHMDYDNAPKYPDVLKRAKQDDITVNAIQAGDDPDTTKVWREIAQLGHGRYMAIPQDGGRITIIETPFDNQIIILQQKIDKTVIPYGDRAAQENIRSKMETKAMAPASVQVDNSRYYSKKAGAKEVVTGGGDLLTDVKNGSTKLDSVDENELPKELRGKSKAELQSYIDKQSAERGAMEGDMTDLVRKRDRYLAEKTKITGKTDKNSFDNVVEETLREQLK
ncbi:von Willebrand factor type A-like protein [Phyllobacterium sp. YR531]|nr:von Willebrand factor type A-like protein [Phyllobacterium sp. YR531]